MGSGFNVVATYDSGFKDGVKAVVIGSVEKYCGCFFCFIVFCIFAL